MQAVTATAPTPAPASTAPTGHAPQLVPRALHPRAAFALEQSGLHPLLARLFASRGIRTADELDDGLGRLLPPTDLKGAQAAAQLLADAIDAQQGITIVADYDCDGATACAVAIRGLKLLGAAPGRLAYVVPDRAVHGYGLTPAIVDLALAPAANGAPRPDLLVTVDNGIASIEGVAHARAQGLKVLVTDHHLAAVDAAGQVQLPDANVIVNPNQPGCGFASKALAGVGVMFYVLLATRAELRERGRFSAQQQPRLDTLLDLVALGTVADVVKLDDNNRRLVAQGLKRIRKRHMQTGVAMLFAAAGRQPERASAFDFGFALGPRLNAAGRLADMTLGIECLLTDDLEQAAELARQLDAINRERRSVEADMRTAAEVQLDRLLAQGLLGTRVAAGAEEQAAAAAGADGPAAAAAAGTDANGTPPALVLFDEDFHEGVVGIVAGRLKDRLHRPTFVLARGQDGLLKGSGRSIPGFHLRDALDLVSKRHPGVLLRFGGHAMAAGCSLAEDQVATFAAALRTVAAEWLAPEALQRRLPTDGPLEAEYFNPATVQTLDAQVWGQGFEAPVFCDELEIVQQRLVADKHLKLRVCTPGQRQNPRDAIWFGRTEPLPDRVRLAYRVSLDEFQGRQRVQMVIEGAAEG